MLHTKLNKVPIGPKNQTIRTILLAMIFFIWSQESQVHKIVTAQFCCIRFYGCLRSLRPLGVCVLSANSYFVLCSAYIPRYQIVLGSNRSYAVSFSICTGTLAHPFFFLFFLGYAVVSLCYPLYIRCSSPSSWFLTV